MSIINNAKIVLLGDAGCGKSSIVSRFIKNTFSEYQESTIGAAFVSKKMNDYNIKFEIWDTAGQERYASLAPMYYRGAKAAIIVYDITNKSSFEKACLWVKKLSEDVSNSIYIIIVGNKSDLELSRKIAKVTVEQFNNTSQYGFIEVSAKTSENINKIFENICQNIVFDQINISANNITLGQSQSKNILKINDCC